MYSVTVENPPAGKTDNVKLRLALCIVAELSVTWTVKLYEPCDVGVPLSTPPVDKFNPGIDAPTMVQL